MNLYGKKVLGGQSLDTMVHPKYRKQGMFITLAQKCLEKAASEGMLFIYGFPNENSHHGLIKCLEWQNIGKFSKLVTFLDLKGVIEKRVGSDTIAAMAEKPARLVLNILTCGRRGQIKLSKCIDINLIDAFDERYDELWARVKDYLPISVWKDSSYLNWRYFSCLKKRYTIMAATCRSELVGFIVLNPNTSQIIDLLGLPGEMTVLEVLLDSALLYLKNKHMRAVSCHVFKGSPFYEAFRRRGFLEIKSQYFNACVRSNTPNCHVKLTNSTRMGLSGW